MPFSWRIKDYLEELWVYARQHEGNIMQHTTSLYIVEADMSVSTSQSIPDTPCCFLAGQTQSQFDEFFWRTPLGRSIAKASPEMQSEFFQRYLQDFISMTMNVRSQENLQVVIPSLATF